MASGGAEERPLESYIGLRLRLTDIPLSACDFHVSNVIDDVVSKVRR